MDTEKIASILAEARSRGREDGIAGMDKGDTADWHDLTNRAVEIISVDPASPDALGRLLEINRAVFSAYQQGWQAGYQERGGGMALVELAQALDIPYDTLAKAAREGRIRAWRSGATWLSTIPDIKKAMEAGTIRPR